MQDATESKRWILCCTCGVTIEPNSANMCLGCIRKEVDITDGLLKQITLPSCRSCGRYLSANGLQWIIAETESRELLGICLKKCKIGCSTGGSSNAGGTVKLVDGGFLWTEPHSKRLKVKVTVQKEVFANTVLQQTYVVDVMLVNQQCGDCEKIMAQNTWKAVVQVRQKVNHKRTFLYLEQLILKHGAHKRCTNIKSQPDGLDFFFGQRNDAVTFVSFLDSVMAIRSKTSEQLISRDIHAGTATYKFTFSVEIVPLCRDDLVAVPKALNSRVFGGGMSPFCLVKRMGHSIHMYDPWKLYFVEIPGTSYWHMPFKGIAQVTDLVPFLVLNVEETGHVVDKYVMADIEITRESDMSKTWIVRSHLGRLLKVGDIALGYDLKGSFGAARMDTVTFEEDSGWQQKVDTLMDEILLVKKQHVKKGGGRKWKLKHLSKKKAGEEDDDLMAAGDDEMQVDSKLTSKSNPSKKASKSTAKKRRTNNSTMAGEDASVARDLEIFMQDLEGDAELRKGVLLYRENSNMFEGLQNQDKENEDYSDSDGASSIDLAELLDDLSLAGSSSDEGQE